MKRKVTLKHEFVEFIPENIPDGVLYVSLRFTTVAHKCCCGCGNEVITPLSPTDWQLAFDGVSVTLFPSIGNWNLACKSHYWIRNNKVIWAAVWSDKEIEHGRTDDMFIKKGYYKKLKEKNVQRKKPKGKSK